MGDIHPHRPVLLFAALLSRYDEALAWARDAAQQAWGPIALASEPFDFVETRYYEPTMGPDLKKQLVAFERLIDPAELVDIKLLSNEWEAQFALRSQAPEPRPLNVDPGYLTEAKLVLASTKDRDHRIYLDRGIYAECTLHFQRGIWQKRDWTYPDYQRADYHRFLTDCRDYLRRRLAQSAGQTNPL